MICIFGMHVAAVCLPWYSNKTTMSMTSVFTPQLTYHPHRSAQQRHPTEVLLLHWSTPPPRSCTESIVRDQPAHATAESRAPWPTAARSLGLRVLGGPVPLRRRRRRPVGSERRGRSDRRLEGWTTWPECWWSWVRDLELGAERRSELFVNITTDNHHHHQTSILLLPNCVSNITFWGHSQLMYRKVNTNL